MFTMNSRAFGKAVAAPVLGTNQVALYLETDGPGPASGQIYLTNEALASLLQVPLLDELAMAAMPSMLLTMENYDYAAVAVKCYKQAQAMMDERARIAVKGGEVK